jgi:hypothetical protein
MTDWASSGRVKIDRAKEHISNLEAEDRAFMEGGPYEIVAQDNVDTGDRTWIVRIHRNPPIRWGAIAGDAIHNLRSALDILWRMVWYPSGGGQSNRKIQFPIYDSPEKYEASRRRVKPSRKRTMVLLDEIRPYKGGNEPLWLLDALDIEDKHRGLILIYSTFMQMTIDFPPAARALFGKPGNLPPGPVTAYLTEPLCPVKDGAELFRVPAAQRNYMDMNPKFSFTIAFGKLRVVHCQPVFPLLVQFADAVDGVANAYITAGLLA